MSNIAFRPCWSRDVTVRATTLTWEVSPAERTPGLGAVLRLGARAVPVSEIRGFIGSADLEIDRKPALATLAVFGLAAVFFLLGVLDVGWRARFLAAAVLFGLIALSAMHDLLWMTTSGLFRVEILTGSGETLRYTTIDPAEQQRLMTALDRAMIRPRGANDDEPQVAAPPAGDGARRRVAQVAGI
jgi:hypothetical protein